eukprot:8235764-Pyramimonas_sp.AAC.1
MRRLWPFWKEPALADTLSDVKEAVRAAMVANWNVVSYNDLYCYSQYCTEAATNAQRLVSEKHSVPPCYWPRVDPHVLSEKFTRLWTIHEAIRGNRC